MIADITFHLLRPWWLLSLLPAALLYWQLGKQRAATTRWSDVIDSELLPELLDVMEQPRSSWPLRAMLLGWICASLALAGPSWQKQDQTALKQADAVVILLDLSPSMLAKDVTPSRLQAAHYKILDLLKARKEGYTGLIAYSGSAHVVSPLSDDSGTVAALVNTLEPGIMPSIGSQTEDAVAAARELLVNSHFPRGRLLLISDGLVPEALNAIHEQLQNTSIELHVIGVGTEQGAPIALPNGGFLKDDQGKIVTSPLQRAALQQLARDNNGSYSDLQIDDSDIAALAAPPAWLTQTSNLRSTNHTVEQWLDSGYWLALPCLLLALLAFRRGVVICLLPFTLVLLTTPQRSEALEWKKPEWQDLWQTPDQQAASALQAGDSKKAAELFQNPEWKAYAQYQNQQPKEAAETLANADSANMLYNRGNALAKSGDLQGALGSYDEALKHNPQLDDAKANRDLVQKLLEQQDKQQQQSSSPPQDQDQQDQNKQQQGGEQQDQPQSAQQQQEPQDPQQGEQQSSEPKSGQDSEQQPSQTDAQQQADGQQTDPQQAEQQQGGRQPQEQKDSQEKVKETEEEQSSARQAEQQSSEEKASEEQTSEIQEKDTVATGNEESTSAEKAKQQMAEQTLRRVPDDPGGLLRNKFEYYYRLNQQQEMRNRRNPEYTEKEQRW